MREKDVLDDLKLAPNQIVLDNIGRKEARDWVKGLEEYVWKRRRTDVADPVTPYDFIDVSDDPPPPYSH